MTTEPFDPEKLLLRLDWAESDDLEFKSAKGGLPGSMWENYSAMANTYGGVILLGVEDDGSITGIKDVAKMRSNCWNMLNNRGKVNLNLLIDADVATVEHADGLRSRYLTSMVAHGLLRLRFRDKPNRADQAYQATDTAHSNGDV